MAFATSTAVAAEPADFDATIQPFFKTYCLRCHNDKLQKGDFRLDTLARAKSAHGYKFFNEEG